MAGLRYKVLNPAGEWIASCRHGEDAANLAGANGDGSKIKDKFAGIVWTEGKEAFSAANSWDGCAHVMIERARTKIAAAQAKYAARVVASAANRESK